ncbi:BEM46-like protein, putative [Plasmodium ovale]|uniref:BEM46-like protein, putative n=1 Tax=Plasmodium ovale TaxID=36330 RepID=A0A1D3KY28_PLAOA|nr:BEM46-like protein, putative [Plasmodium ovale]
MIFAKLLSLAIFGLITSVIFINSYLYLNQDNFIFVKEKLDPKRVQPRGDNYENVSVKTEDGFMHQCWYVKAEDHENKPVILYFQGNGGYLEKYVKLFDMINKRVGANVFSCTNRGCGTNTEEPSEEFFYKDAQVYLNHLKEKKMKHIFLFGSSMGCAVAIETATKNLDDVTGVIVQNPFLSMKKMAKHKKPILFFFLFSYDLLVRTKMKNEEKIKKVNIPMLFNVSEKDEMIPPEHGKTLYELCPSKHKSLFLSKDGTHNNILINDDGAYHRSMKTFIETAIAIKDAKEEKEKGNGEGTGKGKEDEPKA